MRFVKKRILGLIIALFVLSCTFILLSILNFYRVLQNREVAIQEKILFDLSQFTSSYMDVKLEGYMSTLNSLSDLLLLKNVQWENIRERLNSIVKGQEFLHLGLSSADGQVWATDGTNEFIIDITGYPYWQDLLAGKAVITDAQDSVVTANQIFVVAVPILNRENQMIGVVHGAIDLRDFQGYEAARFEIGTYLVFVVDNAGAYILRDHKHPESCNHVSFFDEMTETSAPEEIQEIRHSLTLGEAFQTEGVILNNEYILCFYPLSMNDWYTVVLMPKDEINKHIATLLDDNINVLVICVLIPLVLLCLICFFFLRKKVRMERNNEYQLREKLFSDIEGFIQADLTEDKVVYCSKSLDLPETAMPFSHLTEFYIRNIVDEEYQDRLERIFTSDNLLELFSQGIARISQEYKAKDKTGKFRWFQCDVHMERVDDTRRVIVYFILRNIDEKKQMESALKTKAERDSLTGLYNRSTATDIINVFLHLNSHFPSVNHAFIILDLDNFKVLNDTLLHKTGDKALQDVSSILTNFFRREDVICRLGGDEFVIFLKNIKYEILEAKLKRLMEELRLTYSQDDKSVTISASAGVAISPINGTTFRELYTAADKALYQAKHAGKSCFRRASTP